MMEQNDEALIAAEALAKGDGRPAYLYYGRLVQTDPNNPDYWANYGSALALLGRFQEAIEAYRKSLKLNAVNTIALMNLGDIFYQIGDYDKAIKCYHQLILMRDSNRPEYSWTALLKIVLATEEKKQREKKNETAGD